MLRHDDWRGPGLPSFLRMSSAVGVLMKIKKQHALPEPEVDDTIRPHELMPNSPTRDLRIATAGVDDPTLAFDADAQPAMPLLSGSKYEYDYQLGEGGMGTVLAVNDLFIARKVALKQIKEGKGPECQEKLISEARLLGRFEHPNLPLIYSLEVDEKGSAFYTMQHEGQRTLNELMADLAADESCADPFTSISTKIDIFQGLLQALKYAHELNVLHRDIKPSNVMIGDCGEVKLIDWGLALEKSSGDEGSDELPSQSGFTGTPRYCSPEQANPNIERIDERSDLYSAFICFFELLTLTPYTRPTLGVQETLAVMKSKRPPSVDSRCYTSSFPGVVPKEYRIFIAQGLATSPEDRFQSAEEALEELQRLRCGQLGIHCVVTGTKKVLRSYEAFLDKYPRVVVLITLFITVSFMLLMGRIVFGLLIDFA